ncbi:MAG: energy transducer TonB [Novosphingobium sp.]
MFIFKGVSMGRSGALVLAAGLLALLWTSSPVLADSGTRTFTAISPWRMNEEQASCVLERDFGTTEASSTLRIEKFAPGYDFLLTVIGPAVSGLTERHSLELRFDEAGTRGGIGQFFIGTLKRRSADTEPMLVAKATPFILRDRPAPIMLGPRTMEADGNIVELSWAGQSVVLQTGSLQRALAAMDSCIHKLVDHWGLDSRVQLTLAKHPSPQRWSIRYPNSKIGSNERGLVGLVMGISDTGKPTSCLIAVSYADKVFNQQVCDSVRKWTFDPALTPAGQAVESYYSTTIFFGDGGQGARAKHDDLFGDPSP